MRLKEHTLCFLGILFSCGLFALSGPAITYKPTPSRFGDNLLNYMHAKWVAYVYKIPLAYVEFPFSDQLVLHEREQPLKDFDQPFVEKIYLGPNAPVAINEKKKVLYVVPFFSENPLENEKYARSYKDFFCPVNWGDKKFKALLKKLIKPRFQLQNETPLDYTKITVAIHVRWGDGVLYQKDFPLKFPGIRYYIEALRQVYRLTGQKPIYVHIFTDETKPETILNAFKDAFKGDENVIFNCRREGNACDRNVLEDFFSLTKFDCIILSYSSFSMCASKLGSYAISVLPKQYQIIDNEVNITELDINIDNNVLAEKLDKISQLSGESANVTHALDANRAQINTKPVASAKNYYVLDAPEGNYGFFSCFHMVTGFLDFYEKNKGNCAGINVNFTSGLYLDPQVGPNWWEYFFEPIKIGNELGAKVAHPSDGEKAQWSYNAISKISRDEAARLIATYVHVKPHIKQKVDDFIAKNFKDNLVIGVHYRGTDHFIDATPTPFEVAYEEIMKVINRRQCKRYKIFIATDEQKFLDYITARCKNVICYDAHRSTDGIALHTQFQHNYFIGEEALVDCLLLSRCDIIIRTYSNLNSAAANINPNIPIITLNKLLPHLPAGLR
jgi:hypothetical protein